MNADILNTGTAINIKGKHSGHYYEGLLYDSDVINDNTFSGKQYLVDIKDLSEREVVDFHDIHVVEDGQIPVNSVKGKKYMIIDGKPRFGKQYTTLEDLKGT